VAATSDAQAPHRFDPAKIQAIVLERDEADASRLAALRVLGANTVITHSRPSLATARAANLAGLFYIAFLTTRELDQASRDVSFPAEVGSMPGLVGFYYLDDGVVEGYTSTESQARAYQTLKGMFPDKLVLYPTRLDLFAIDSGYRDNYFRPQFTDLVTPYFYPVGTTSFGSVMEDSPWAEAQLSPLLASVVERMPLGQGVLPVLQGFEPIGYHEGRRFLLEQIAVYRRFWPEIRNAAVFAWEIEVPQPLIELFQLPDLQMGVCDLFATFSSRPSRCGRPRQLAWRSSSL
jgi:hypothetical protein